MFIVDLSRTSPMNCRVILFLGGVELAVVGVWSMALAGQ